MEVIWASIYLISSQTMPLGMHKHKGHKGEEIYLDDLSIPYHIQN